MNNVEVKTDESGQSFILVRLDISPELLQDLGSLPSLCDTDAIGEEIKRVFLEAVLKSERRTKKIEKKIQRRRALLKKETLTDKQVEELKRLNAEIYAIPGETQSEMTAMDILKDFAQKLEASKLKS